MELWIVGFLNFCVNVCLLTGVNRLIKTTAAYGQIALASVIGAVYSSICLYTRSRFLNMTYSRMIVLLIMGIIAFGLGRSGLKRCGIFLLICFALGGVVTALSREDVPAIILMVVLFFLAIRRFLEGTGNGQEYFPVEIYYAGKCLKLTALRDTGNCLCDPITGQSILIIGSKEAGELLGFTPEELRNPLETLTAKAMQGLRLVPYNTVGKSGVMLAKRLEQVKVDGKIRSVIVAFAPEALASDRFQALAGGSISWGS